MSAPTQPTTPAQVSVPRSFPVLAEGERAVPAVLRVRVLFGGRRQRAACLWLAGVSAVFWGFDVFGAFNDALPFVAEREAYATITGSHETSASTSVTGGESGPIWRYQAEGIGDDGGVVLGRGYVTGGGDRTGARVVVRYSAAAPERGVIDGMRGSLFGGFGLLLLVAILPVLGFAIVTFHRAARDVELLAHGKLAIARRVSKHAAMEKGWEYTFAYDTERGPATLRVMSKGEHIDDEREPVLYDARDVRGGKPRAALLGELAGDPRISEAGAWLPSDWEWWFAPAPLALVVLGNVVAAFVVR